MTGAYLLHLLHPPCKLHEYLQDKVKAAVWTTDFQHLDALSHYLALHCCLSHPKAAHQGTKVSPQEAICVSLAAAKAI